MKLIILLILTFVLSFIHCLIPIDPWSTQSSSICDHKSTECRFYLRSTSLMTMFYKDLYRVVSNEERILSKYNNVSMIYPMEAIITADGYPKLVCFCSLKEKL